MGETREVRVAEVKAHKTRSGNTRYVLADDEGNEYSTFREAIARAAVAAEGGRARIRFHEEERNGFTNVYLDAVERLQDDAEDAATVEREVEEAAWDAAIEAAPWLLGGEPKRKIPADQLYETLKPFKDRVADDIKE